MGENSSYKEYLAGLFAGVSTVITGHPFDTVKVKMQKHNTEAHGIVYRNGLHCTARILKIEGIKGLYRGATSSFVGMAFESSLLFGIYSQTKLTLGNGEKDTCSIPALGVIIPSAVCGGAFISFVLCPSELVKCRMQVQGTDSLVPKSSRYSSPLDCVFRTVKTAGVSGIFQGGLTTLMRESFGNAFFFSAYEYIRYYTRSLKPASSDNNKLIDGGIGILSGGLGGVAFWLAVLPLDVAKTKIQTSLDKDSTKNPLRVLNLVYKSGGIRGCYAGLVPTLVRAFPANAAAIVTWETALKFLGDRRGSPA